MNASELLRQELISKLPFTKQELINKVVECVRRDGYYAFYWGRHTSRDMHEFSNDSIHIVKDWIREEGFRIESSRSCYGVPEYYVTL